MHGISDLWNKMWNEKKKTENKIVGRNQARDLNLICLYQDQNTTHYFVITSIFGSIARRVYT